MKIVVLIILFFFQLQTIDKLNLLTRENRECNEQERLVEFTIDCASNLKITFKNATLLFPQNKEYKLKG